MKFYALKYQLDPNEIGGTYPQSQTLNSEISRNAENNLYSVFGKFPADLYVPDPVLHPKAKITDLISTAWTSFMLISGKLKAVIENYRQDALEFAPATLIARNQKLLYWFMNGFQMDYKNIDFSASVIGRSEVLEPEYEVLAIKTLNDFEMALKNTQLPLTVVIKKLILTKTIKDDIFFLDRVLGNKCFVSEKLKAEIERAGCTGILFEPCE